MRTESLVVMLTDIKGFTAATTRQTREENARMLAAHEALLAPVLAAFGGRKVKTIGDAYLVLFPAPTAALLCAAAIQDRLHDHGRRVVEADRIEVRIALALGEVRLQGGDVFGEPVNLASRIEAEAAPGEIWFSEATYWALDRARVPVEELGWRALPGLAEEVRLFRVARAAPLEGEPPYAGIGLDLVAGLAPPEPEALARAGRWPASLLGTVRPERLLALALGLLLVAALGGALWWFTVGRMRQEPGLHFDRDTGRIRWVR